MAYYVNDHADLLVATPDDWQRFRDQHLNVIADPMVFRAADVFLRGRMGAASSLPIGDPEAIWSALTGDLGSLTTFFDQIILAERLPLIDYGITFDSTLRYDSPWVGRIINEALEEQVVVTVHIHGQVSADARNAALAALPGRPRATSQLENDVRHELTALDYQWRPDLGVLGAQGEDVLSRFLYGGLVFGAFAQMSGASHVLQPKRWRLMTAMALGTPSAAYAEEASLVAEIDRRIQTNPQYKDIKLASLPPLLPYMLSKEPRGPTELLRVAKELRADAQIKEYRGWRSRLLRNWVDRGLIEESSERDINRVVRALHQRFRGGPAVDVKAEVGVGVSEKGVGITAGLSIPISVDRIWGWISDGLPGHRYMKVLTRLKITEHQYAAMDRHLRTVWEHS